MSTETTETLDLWACEFYVTAHLLDDPPAWEMAKTMQVDSAKDLARKQGYDLVGDPEITETPAVWLDSWNDGRGGLVDLEMARWTGYDGEPTAYRYVYRFPARKQPQRRMQRKDIDDQHVIDLAQKWSDAPYGKHPGVVMALVAEGIPEKLALSKVEHLHDRGYLECGVPPYYSWPTGKKLP